MEKIFAQNKKAGYHYSVIEKYEAGVVLLGKEVKSIQNGRININGAHIAIEEGRIYLKGADVAIYQPNNKHVEYDPARNRELLMKKNEVLYLQGKIQQKGLTLVPLKVYTKKAKIKVEFALARGKKLYDKREKLKKRDHDRELRSSF